MLTKYQTVPYPAVLAKNEARNYTPFSLTGLSGQREQSVLIFNFMLHSVSRIVAFMVLGAKTGMCAH